MITIFGASGRIGGQVVRQGLEAGHEITAVVRGELAHAAHPRLTVVRADVMDPAAITAAVAGAQAVISALGPPNGRPTTVLSDGVRSIMTAMEKSGTSRLLVVSADGAFPSPADGPLMRTVLRPLLQRILRNVFTDTRAMEELVRASSLDWTIVRPPRLTNAPLTRAYRLAADGPLPGARSVPRADVADCLLALAPDPAYRRATVTVAT
ncbi:SDR family oxidoreductase [Actinocorallia lasiicapitis]